MCDVSFLNMQVYLIGAHKQVKQNPAYCATETLDIEILHVASSDVKTFK